MPLLRKDCEAMSYECARCGRPLTETHAVYCVTPECINTNARKYACWDCLTRDERKRKTRKDAVNR